MVHVGLDGHASHHSLHRRSHGAAGSSRVQVVVLAAARLRALHLDPLVTASGCKPPTARRKKNGFASCPGPRLHRERPRGIAGVSRPRFGLSGSVAHWR
jgi:hypothetical protein